MSLFARPTRTWSSLTATGSSRVSMSRVLLAATSNLSKAGLKKPRREIDDATAVKADIIVTNLKESMVSEEQGDLFGPIERGLIDIGDVFELGDFATGNHPGRTSDQQITYHKNNNGTGSSEMAMAITAYRGSRRR